MQNYKCTKCSYIYKPDRGDWMSGADKGTPFEALPDDWKCPTCGQPKEFLRRNDYEYKSSKCINSTNQ